MTKLALDAESAFMKDLHKKNEEKEFAEQRIFHEALLPLINKALVGKGKPEITIESDEFKDIFKKYMKASLEEELGKRGKKEKESYEYYPLCEYSIITMFDKNTHPSYITAGVEICEDIFKYPPVIKEGWNEFQINQRNEMITFAKEFLIKWESDFFGNTGDAKRGETTEDIQ